jgi:hypothetical protein
VFLVGDRARATARFGARGYRILSQEAGAIAQRISLLAAAGGLAARVVNQYREAEIGALLGLGTAVPIFEILVGRDSLRASYDLPIGC